MFLGFNQTGFSILELLIASFIGMMAVVGILYIYKAHHKSVLIQSGIAEMRMNGQYTLREAQYNLSHAGLGLPNNFKNLQEIGNDLIVKVNTSRKFCQGTMDASSTSTKTLYKILRTDTLAFSGRSYVAVTVSGKVIEAPIINVAIDPSDASSSLLTLLGNKSDFDATSTLYPLEKIILHLCTGVGVDTVAGDFQVLEMDAKKRPGLNLDTLTLAEGIESLKYKYYLYNKDSVTVLPVSMDQVERIGVTVVAKSLIKNPVSAGDGYKRDTLVAKMGYRKAM